MTGRKRSASRPQARRARAAAPPGVRPIDLSPLTSLVGFCVRIAQLQVFEQFHREMWRRHRLHPGAYSVLVAVRVNPGVQPGSLADVLSVKRPNMSKLLDSLERRGWLERRRQKTDGRSVSLFLTEEGAKRIAHIAEENMAMDARAAGGLTAREHKQLIALLQKFSSHLRSLNEHRIE